jgi:hypothetical protein
MEATIAETKRLCLEAEAGIARLVIVDIEIGLTFCRIAKRRTPGYARVKTLENARKAYKAGENWLWRLRMTHAHSSQVAAQLERLRFELDSAAR